MAGAVIAETERMLREEEVTKVTGLSAKTIRRLERQRGFPVRRKTGARCVGWLASEIEEWLRNLQPIATN